MQFVKRTVLIGCLLILSNSAIAALPARHASIAEFGSRGEAGGPSPTGYVNDFAHVLDSQTSARLENTLSAFEAKTGDEVAVATVASLDGTTIEDYAVHLYQQWGIGKKGKDNGVLIVVCPSERQMRIEVGYGLEGVINDAMAGRIIREKMIPFFKTENYSDGIVAGTQTVLTLIAHDKGIELNSIGVSDENISGPQVRQKKSLFHKVGSVIMFFFLVYLFIRHPWLFLFFLSGMGGGGRSGGFGGGFGGFGGGLSGGGGSSGRW